MVGQYICLSIHYLCPCLFSMTCSASQNIDKMIACVGVFQSKGKSNLFWRGVTPSFHIVPKCHQRFTEVPHRSCVSPKKSTIEIIIAPMCHYSKASQKVQIVRRCHGSKTSRTILIDPACHQRKASQKFLIGTRATTAKPQGWSSLLLRINRSTVPLSAIAGFRPFNTIRTF